MMLEIERSGDSSQSCSDSWTSGESSQRSSDSGGVSTSCDHGVSYLCIASLSGHSGPVASLAVVGNMIYSGGSDGSDILVWSQPAMSEVCRFGSGDGAVKAIVMLGDQVVSAHQDMKIRVWKTASGLREKKPKLVATLPTLKDFVLRCIPEKNYVQVRRHKKSLFIQHNDAISVLALGRGNSNVLYSGSWDKTIKVWRTSDFRCLESISAHDDAVSSLVADQQGFLFSASADATVKVWTKNGKKHYLVTTLVEHKSSVNALAMSPDESLLYAASSDKTISVWDITRGGVDKTGQIKLVESLTGHRRAVLCMAAVGDILCTGSADKTIRVWRRSRNCHSLVTILEGHRGPVKSVCGSSEAVESGLLIYSGSLDRSVKVWWIAPRAHCTPVDGPVSPYAVDSSLQLKWRH